MYIQQHLFVQNLPPLFCVCLECQGLYEIETPSIHRFRARQHLVSCMLRASVANKSKKSNRIPKIPTHMLQNFFRQSYSQRASRHALTRGSSRKKLSLSRNPCFCRVSAIAADRAQSTKSILAFEHSYIRTYVRTYILERTYKRTYAKL